MSTLYDAFRVAAPVRYLDGRNDIWDAAPQETRYLSSLANRRRKASHHVGGAQAGLSRILSRLPFSFCLFLSVFVCLIQFNSGGQAAFNVRGKKDKTRQNKTKREREKRQNAAQARGGIPGSAARRLGCKATRLHGYSAARLLCCTAARLLGCLVALRLDALSAKQPGTLRSC